MTSTYVVAEPGLVGGEGRVVPVTVAEGLNGDDAGLEDMGFRQG